ncbi:MAG: hypothetical protein ACRDFX_08315 [Chloroflexota bacterium]
MGNEGLSATTIINAPAGSSSPPLPSQPSTPRSTETGWVCDPLESTPLTAAGQVFRMGVYHPNHPDGNYQTANRVQIFDPPHAIAWEPGHNTEDGLGFGAGSGATT